MKEHYVSYSQAVKLKELGFDWPTSHYYCAFDNETDVRFWDVHPKQSQNAFRSPKDKVIADAPRLDQAQAWLREVKGIDIELCVWLVGNKREYRPYVMPHKCKDYIAYPPEKSYELALSAGIDAAIELLTNKQTDK